MGRRSVFRDPNKLALSYIPEKIPHREDKLAKLKEYFNDVIFGDLNFEHVFIIGNSGTGKTLIARHFERYLNNVKSNKNIIPIYINARLERSPGNIVRKIISKIPPRIAKRGYSLEEIFSGFLKYINENDIKVVLILDDADHLFNSYKEFIYQLSRADELTSDFKNNLSLLFILHSIDGLSKLDRWTAAGLRKNIIYFEDYTYEELLDILLVRCEEAFHPDAYTLETLETAADTASKYNFNARYAIELMCKAGLIADSRREPIVKPEHVRLARNEVPPSFTEDELKSLHLHEKILLYSIAELLSGSDKAFITTGELERRYIENAHYFSIEPVKHTWLWKMINALSSLGLISKRISSKGYRGKTTLIGLPSFPADLLRKTLYKMIVREVGCDD